MYTFDNISRTVSEIMGAGLSAQQPLELVTDIARENLRSVVGRLEEIHAIYKTVQQLCLEQIDVVHNVYMEVNDRDVEAASRFRAILSDAQDLLQDLRRLNNMISVGTGSGSLRDAPLWGSREAFSNKSLALLKDRIAPRDAAGLLAKTEASWTHLRQLLNRTDLSDQILTWLTAIYAELGDELESGAGISSDQIRFLNMMMTRVDEPNADIAWNGAAAGWGTYTPRADLFQAFITLLGTEVGARAAGNGMSQFSNVDDAQLALALVSLSTLYGALPRADDRRSAGDTKAQQVLLGGAGGPLSREVQLQDSGTLAYTELHFHIVDRHVMPGSGGGAAIGLDMIGFPRQISFSRSYPPSLAHETLAGIAESQADARFAAPGMDFWISEVVQAGITLPLPATLGVIASMVEIGIDYQRARAATDADRIFIQGIIDMSRTGNAIVQFDLQTVIISEPDENYQIDVVPTAGTYRAIGLFNEIFPEYSISVKEFISEPDATFKLLRRLAHPSSTYRFRHGEFVERLSELEGR